MSMKNILLPVAANNRVKKLWDDMVELSKDYGTISNEYQQALMEVNERFGARFSEHGNKMYELKKEGITEICKIAGIEWKQENGYAVEASYFEFGHTYLSVKTPDVSEDATPEQRALLNMEIPAGSKAN